MGNLVRKSKNLMGKELGLSFSVYTAHVSHMYPFSIARLTSLTAPLRFTSH
jgi:hypothetical protein